MTQDATETFAVQDIASGVSIPEPGEIHDWGGRSTEQIASATANKGMKVLTRAVERYVALIRDLEMFYAPSEVPEWMCASDRSRPRFDVDY